MIAWRIVLHRRQPLGDILADGAAFGEVRLLLQIGDARAGLPEAFAGIDVDEAGQRLHQGRFAAAIAADQAQPVADGHGQVGILEHRIATEAQTGAAQCHDGGIARHIYDCRPGRAVRLRRLISSRDVCGCGHRRH